MRFRVGLVMGFGAGYVLGARAGRQRYEQIRRAWHSALRSEPAQQLGHDMRDVATRTGHRLESKASEGMAKVTDLVRSGSDGRMDDDPAAPPPSA